jgi:hypothetical protein
LKTKDFLTQKFKISGFSYSLNAKAHREPPHRGLSGSSEPQPGSDAVTRLARLGDRHLSCQTLAWRRLLSLVQA